MSKNVDFILSLDDKQFTVAINRAGKLLGRFGDQAAKPAQKINSLERSLGSVARILGVLDTKLSSTADKLQDAAVGFELVTDASRKARTGITSLNASLKTLTSTLNSSTTSVRNFTGALNKVQSELNEFSDWSNYAGKAASRFGSQVKDASASVTGMNTRLSTTTKRLGNWGVSTNQASEGLKKVRERMDEIISRQQIISKPVQVRTGMGGSGGGTGNNASPLSGFSRNNSYESGLFSGLRGSIFMLGEIGDAARAVKGILFDWQKPIIEANALFERTTAMLKGMAETDDPTREAQEGLDYIINRAKTAPISIAAITDGFVKLKSTGIDPTTGSMDALVDAVAQFGGNDEVFKRAAIAIQQMSGKGVVSMEELRQQLGEAIPTAMKAMASGLGVTVAQLTKTVSKGVVAAKPAIDAMLLMLEVQYGGAAERMMSTISGMVSYTKTNLMLLAKEFGESGFNDAIKGAMRDFNTLIESAQGKHIASVLGQGMGELISNLTEVSKWLLDNADKVQVLGEIIALYLGVRIIRSITSGLVSGFASIGNAAKTQGNVVRVTFSGVTAAMQNYVNTIRTTVTPSVDALSDAHVRLRQRMNAVHAMRTMWAGMAASIASAGIGIAIAGIVTGLVALVEWYQRAKNAAKEYSEKAKNAPDTITPEEQKEAEQRILDEETRNKGLRSQIESLKSQIENSKNNSFLGAGNAFTQDYERRLKQTEKLVEESDKRLLELKKEYEIASFAVQQQIADKELKAMEIANQKKIEEERKNVNKLIKLKDEELKAVDARQAPSDEKVRLREQINQEKQDAVKGYFEFLAGQWRGIQNELQKEISATQEKLNSEGSRMSDEERRNAEDRISALQTAFEKAGNNADSFARKINEVAKMMVGMIGLGGEVIESNSNKLLERVQTLNRTASRQLEREKARNGELKDEKGRVIGEYEAAARQTAEDAKQNASKVDLTEEAIKGLDKYVETERQRDELIKKREQQRKFNSELKKTNTELEKQKRLTERTLADGKVLAETIAGQGNALAAFDKKLEQTKKALEDIIAKKGTKYVSEEEVNQAAIQLTTLKEKAQAYREELEKTTAQSLISKFAPKTDSLTGYGETRDGKRARLLKDIKETEEGLQKLLNDRSLSQNQREVILSRYQQVIAGKNRAFISEAGTATQQLALQYEDIAGQIETAWADAFSNMSDMLTDFVMKGKLDFRSLVESIVRDITSMVIKNQITLPLMNMLGMGTTPAGNMQSGNQTNGLLSAISNQGASLISGAISTSPRAGVVNGDKSIGEASREAVSGVGSMQTASENAASGLDRAVSGVKGLTTSLSGGTAAMKGQTMAIKDSIFSMSNLSSVAGSLATVFAMMGATSGSSKNRWLNLGLSVASTAVSAFAAGGFSFGGGGGSASGFNNLTGPAMDGTRGIPAIPKFANGGIFGKDGVVPLRAYQRGGIATSPQLALFGEGSMNEAYVPLPDGRSIPVTMKTEGGGGGGLVAPVSINITVNKDGSSTQEGDDNKWAGEMASRVKNIVIDTLIEQQRPGGSLNPNTKRG